MVLSRWWIVHKKIFCATVILTIPAVQLLDTKKNRIKHGHTSLFCEKGRVLVVKLSNDLLSKRFFKSFTEIAGFSSLESWLVAGIKCYEVRCK